MRESDDGPPFERAFGECVLVRSFTLWLYLVTLLYGPRPTAINRGRVAQRNKLARTWLRILVLLQRPASVLNAEDRVSPARPKNHNTANLQKISCKKQR